MLIRLPILEDALMEQMEGRLSSIARSRSQFDREDGVSSPHHKKSPRTGIVEDELDVLGFALVVVCVTNGGSYAKLSI